MSLDEIKQSPWGFDPEIPRISVAHSSPEFSTLVEVLRHRAAQQPHQLSHSFLLNGETEEISLTYAQLEQRAMCIAVLLQGINATGKRVLLLYPPGLEYIAAFFGCLYAGAVAVPAYPPRINRSLGRLQAIAKDAQPVAALTTASIVEKVDKLLDQAPELKNLRWINTDNISLGYAQHWRAPRIEDTTLAFLQYTSGSTSTPKGVMVSHGNLLHNERLIQRVFRQNEDSIIVGWLPLYHDMGLIGNVLQPLFLGAPCILMSPVAFLQRPLRWLQAISRYRATTSGGPNFAFDLCVNKISFEERETLDLSSWKVAFNGAEPIRSETIERFAEAFAPCGFRRETFYPCYGLAEATLLVSGKSQAGPPFTEKVRARELLSNRVVRADEGNEDLRALISCGSSLTDQEILVVNPDSCVRCDADTVGEIWVASPSVAQGYWNRPDESKRTFEAHLAGTGEGPFLRTGDLGFIQGGELFVTGRLKDLIIIRGMNHYPQDIELTVEQAHRNLRAGGGAAFSIAVDGEEQLVVVQELVHRHPSDWPAVVEAMVQAVAERHELQLHAVVLVKSGSIPKTSSGKIQRHLCRDSFLADNLEVVFEWRATATAEAVKQRLNPDQLLGSVGEIEVWLKEMFAERLGLEPSRVEVDQPLARYGIDSLIAVELVHSIEVLTGVSLSLVTFLQDVSITELAIQLHARLKDTTSHEPPRPIHSVPTNTEHRPSIGQQALWFLQQLEPKSAAYNIARALRLRTQLDVTALRHAFQEVVNRHASLRTVFVDQDQLPMCRVRKDLEVCFLEEDATTWSDAFLSERLSEEARSPFNLENGPLLRIVLFTRSPGEHVLLLTVHHIVADFWSLGVLMKEVASLYEAELSGSQEILAPLALEYADYTRWQTQMLQSEEGEHLWAYWQQQLSGDLPVVNLPTDKSRPLAQTFEGKSYNFKLSRALTSKLKSLAQAQDATLYMTLLASFQVLLYHYTGQEDILVGSPVAGRSHADFKKLVGYFVNPVVLRADVSGRPRFTSFLKRVRQTALEAFAHQEFPFPLLVERLQPNRDLSRSPLFQIMFVMQKMELLNDANISSFALGAPGGTVTLGALTFESLPLEQRIAQFDLTLLMAEASGELAACFEYSTDLFEHSTIERMAGHFVSLLESIVDAPEQQVTEYSLLTAAEHKQVVVEWNRTATAAGSGGKCLHEYFEAQVEKTPEAIALICGSEELTYAELNERANAVGHQLRREGVGAEVRVGICLGRRLELVVGILGVLKAGGAYVPLDPAYPQERLGYMLADSQATVILTSAAYEAQLPATEAKLIRMERIGQQRRENLPRVVGAENLAYVIYTSGSTGAPKGVAIEHRSVAAFLEWTQTVFALAQLQGTLAATSICFDLSVFEIFAPLACGGAVILAENILALAGGLAAAARVTLVNTVPSAMAELLRLQALPASVETVNLAGEALSGVLVQQLYQQSQVRQVYNLYGPSEDTTYSTYQGLQAGQAPTIGRPIANTKAYILSAQQRVVPIGVNGELYLSGAGLARGYLGQAGQTAERFVPDPYGGAGARMYRTGDVARYLGNGEIEFLGRADQQVKVRGYRIELGEIEAVLAGHSSVAESVVLAREDIPGDKRLTAYLVANQGRPATATQLRSYLQQQLPDYMVPSAFIWMDGLPLTPNGKVDRRALPVPDDARPEAELPFAVPRTPIEEIVAGIWTKLLGLAQVGIHDNFFDLGGHSLLATQLISRVREALHLELPLRAIFESPTVAKLSEAIVTAQNGAQPLQMPSVKLAPRNAEIPLSYAQQRLWFLEQLESDFHPYNMPGAVRLTGRLNVEALAHSLNEVIRRHEILRTTFVTRRDQPRQVISPPWETSLSVTDLQDLSETAREDVMQSLIADEARQRFDLIEGPLFRTALLKLSEEDHVLLFTMHHIISDGWSIGVLIREITALYQAYSEGADSPLTALPIQYADFAVWQRQCLEGEAMQAQLSYWQQQLQNSPPLLELPIDHPRPAIQTFRGASLPLVLPESLSAGLKALSRQEDVTLFMTVLAAFAALLNRYTGQDDIAVGTPIAGRTQVEVESLIGCFVNTLVLRADLSGDPRFTELLGRMKETALAAYAHQDLPFEKLVEELQPERNLNRTPLFQAMFVMQNAQDEELKLPGLELTRMEVSHQTAKFDLTLTLEESASGLSGSLQYNTDLFDAESIARMGEHFRTLLQGIADNPKQRLSSLPLLTEEERHNLLVRWNDTATEYPAHSCLHWLFEAQAEQTPDAIAIVFGNEEITYKDLNTRANKFAHRLRALGVRLEVPVGIMAKRSVEMVVGLLAILKAGGAYLPLEPEYPDERLSFMLADSGASVLLAQSTLAPRFADFTGTVVSLDEQAEASEVSERGSIPRSVTPENLAYVIYTSGSTGRPKGVQVTHASVCNHLRWRQSAYPLSASDSFLQKASISFDISVWEIFAPLLAGARLVLAEPGGQRDSAYLGRLIAEKQITVAHFHPAMLRAVLQEPDAARWTSLRQVFCGGETLPPETQRLFFDTVRARLCHQYGPTETTIDVAAWDCSPDDARVVIPIGRPISNTRLYMLDGELRPVPVGLPGELYVGGLALARAYLNRPGLTAERFVPDPFSREPGGRLYRTGDHARWLSDGTVQFLGRADAQVKVRGYRVELGEIEAALASHPEVREAAAAAHADAGGERRLVGYVVARSERQPSISEMRNFLLEKLPDYMAPSSFVFLDSLPLTANGKVNRQALPLPDQSRPELDQAFVAPQTPVEQMIAGVWREVLGTEQIGVNDNFFELGGHSLLATQVVARLSEAFGIALPLRAIFESPTIAGLSEKIDTAVRSEQNVTLPPILPVSRDQDLPLSFPQERLWLLHQLHPRSVAYHVLRPLRIVGTLDVKLLERVLTEVVSRHEVYRTNIVMKQGRPVQIINPPQPIELPVTDLSGLSREEREEQVQHLITEEGQRPFNLAHGPLWRLTLLRLDEAEHLLMLTEHHVVHDGWTEGRLVLDFLALYAAMATGQPSPLPELSIQYADFAYWQRQTIQGELLESLLSYWKKQLADGPPMLELPGDFPRPAVMSFRGANSTWQFTPELTKALNVLSRREGATLYMTLMAAFNVLLHRYTRQEDIVIGTPIANRNHIETELLTGFFVNTLVMRNDLSGNPDFRELLGRVREVSLGAYMHQDMPFERLVEELQPDRALNRQPLFQVMFVLQNAPNPPMELPDLTVETLRVHNGTSKFDLLLAMREDGDRLTAEMEYNTDIFAENTIQRMLQHFQNLLEAIVANPEQRISELPLMKEAERQQLLVDWNNTEIARREDRSIVQLFEDQVERTPEAVALIFQGESLTYKKLNERANQLAHFLQSRGVGPEVFVGICMQRSVEMMVSVLGVLKAGGAYLPLDPTYPKDRLSYMIGDTKAHVLLTQQHLLEILPEHSAQVVCLDSYWKIIAQEEPDNPLPVVAPENLVYVTYTSGSTGKPKGIGMIQHSLLNLLDWMCRTTQLPEGARTVQFASLSFDVSFQDMFSTWFSGGTLVLLTEDERRDIVGLAGVLSSNDVHRIFIPAVALQQLAEGLCAHDPQTSQLRRVIAGSEQLHVTQPIAKFFSQSKDCSLHNEYGPSETHVVTALSLPTNVTSWPSRPPIGRPISNTQIYLLEESLQPAPIGVPGELYIGGAGLARGYLGRPDLTAEKFLPDPFSRQPGARFYRTGDMARYQPGGNIEFLGRKDHQVKIRGFRIELGEIETVLGQHPAVQETIVLTWERTAGDRHLVAYVVFQPGPAPSISEMRNFLLEKLPDYMVPSSFVFLDSLPLTANGKVNRQALPLPDQSRPELEQAFVAPQTPLEQVIAGVWREVLGTEQIGVNDNFFELGGHSLLATQVVGRLSEAFEFELPLRTMFESPTIAGLAASMVQLEPTPGSLEAVAQLLLEFAQLSEEDAQSLLDVELRTTENEKLLDSHQAEDQTEISVG